MQVAIDFKIRDLTMSEIDEIVGGDTFVEAGIEWLGYVAQGYTLVSGEAYYYGNPLTDGENYWYVGHDDVNRTVWFYYNSAIC